MIAKCACEVCSQQIEFDVENDGTLIQCPHCNLSTTLRTRKAYLPPPVQPAQIEQVKERKRIEESLDEIGISIFGIGICAAIVTGLISVGAFTANESALGLSMAMSAIVAFAQGVIFKALFYALAEIIRLLRTIAAKSS